MYETWEQLKADCMGCRKCDLCETRTNLVFGVGNENAEVLDTNGNPIPHLYSAGEMGGITSCMYQGGTNIAECIIAKNRHGETGKVELRWLPEYTSFGTLENRYQEEG